MPTTLRFPAGHVCVVLLSGLGDVVHGLPVVNSLKDDDPKRRISWVVEPVPSALLRPHPGVDEVVVYEKARGWAGARKLWRDLRGRRFDLTLNLNIYLKSILPTVLSRAPHRVGLDRARVRDAVWLFYNHPLPARPRAHTQDQFLEFLDYLGLRDYSVDWRLTLTEEERQAQREFLRAWGDRPCVAIVPSSAKPQKDWMPDRYARGADALEADFGFRTVLVGGPGKREVAVAQEVVRRSSGRPVWALGASVRRILWVLGACRHVIAPDAGPLPIARAVEVPVIGLYGHTNPWRTGPYRRFDDLWVDRYTGADEEPDASRFEARSGRMELISVRDVLERVDRAVSRYLQIGTRST